MAKLAIEEADDGPDDPLGVAKGCASAVVFLVVVAVAVKVCFWAWCLS